MLDHHRRCELKRVINALELSYFSFKLVLISFQDIILSLVSLFAQPSQEKDPIVNSEDRFVFQRLLLAGRASKLKPFMHGQLSSSDKISYICK
jgi:hypothetical protein